MFEYVLQNLIVAITEIINKSVNKIISEDINQDSIDIHSKMFISVCSFFKENQDKSRLYYKTEYSLSLLVKAWLDHFIKEYDIETWEEINNELSSNLLKSFKYLYNIYCDEWPREEWNPYEGEYVTLEDDYYVIKESYFKKELLKYIKLIIS